MNERWQRIERIFHEARRRKGPDRDNFLREELGDETSIRKEVESLLAEPSAPGSILEAPLAAAAFRVLAQGPEPSLVGETLLQYKIEARIGAGGMGEVYFARDTNLDRKVALKVLSGPSDNKDDAVARLHQEARAASALNHPNIITIYDFGRVDSTDFIAMEFVSGETLREKLRGGRPSVPEAVDIAIQIARALAAAHREGIVHRDIKPENVMVRDDAVVKVLDFGIAKFREEMDAVSNPAQPGTPGNRGSSSVVFGTVHYLAPEQARREVTDALSDIFSLGIVLYEMIAGERPFNAADAAGTINEIINKEPEPLSLHRSSVPPELQGIVSRALNKNRAERFQSASQMMAELLKLKEQLSRGQPNAHVMQPHRDYTRWIMPVAAIFGLLAGLDLVAGVPRGVREILDLGVLSLFSAYGIVILGLRRKRRVPDAASEVVFQGLAPFQEEDRDRFLGREQDTSAMFQMLTQESFRFGVLYGESGCGKSSLIAAGLAPDLRAARFEVVICRSYKDPLKSIVETCWQWCRLAPLEAEQPAEYLARITTEINGHDGAEKGLVIMCDQFEEFFVNLKTQDEREPFLSFVESCTRAKNLRVRFLFCIRADFLHHIISAFDTRVPEPLLGAKRYGLRSFEQERAEEIIVKTAALAGLPIHRELCQAVARDLAPSGTVLASELQIVGAQLQAKRIFNLDDYLRAGGKEQLVHGFLDDLIKSSTDRRTTEALLAAMISGESTRLTLSLDEIVGRTQRDEASVEAVLRQLVRTRLIREVNDYGTSRYELIHEYLIEGINAITGHVIGATRRANRMLRQYVTSYSVDKRTRIPLRTLWSIRRYSDMPIGEREKELLGKSLRWDLGKAGALVCSFLIAAIALAAPLSVREGWDGGVRLSDGHRRAVRQVVFSPDGRLVVSVGEDAKAIVWDFARRKPLATLTDQTDWITSVAFSPDGKYFATGSQDNTIVVWDATSIEKAHVFRVAGAVVGVAFSPDAQLLAAGSTVPDPAVTVWRVGQWLKVWQRPLGGQIGAPWNSLFSPDSRWILASDGRGAAVTWDVASGDLIDQDDNGWTGYKALSPDGKQIVSAGGKVRFWDSSRYWKRKEKRLLTSQLAHDDFGRAAAFSPDGRFAATGAEDTILWDATTHEVITHFTYPAIVWGLAFSPDGRSLISSHADGSILIWDVRQRKLVGNLNGHVGGVRAVAFSADGRHIASAGDDHSVIIWGAETGKKEQTLLKHTARINAVAFSPDGRSIISGDQSDSVLMWDVTGDRGYPRWTATSGSDYCMAMSPDGRWAADSSGVWATADGHRVVNFAVAGLGGMYGAAFSSDGHMLTCVAPAPNAISLWDTESWRVIARLDTASGPLITVSLSPDGKWLVTGDDDGVVRLWSVRPLREEAIIGRHGSRLKSVVFSHDGTLIASAGDDKTIALWDFQSRKLITRIGTHASRVLSVAFSPDDKQLVSGEEDGSVNVFTRRRTLWGHRLD